MKPPFFCLAFLIVAFDCAALAPLDPEGLAGQLRQLHADLDSEGVGPVLAGLPAVWDVASPERRYSISTEPLRSLLVSAEAEADSKVRSDNVRQAKTWLDHLAQQLESFSRTPTETISTARSRLDHILARSEFAGVRPPSAWELFRTRVALWIASLVQKFFGFAAQHPTGGLVLFWALVAGAVGVLAAWLIQLWTRRDPLLKLPEPNPVVRSQSWEAWVRDACNAANQGDPREAIRCTYWAAVARLQEGHVLPGDLTRTPREYLRLISAPQQDLPIPSSSLASRAMLLEPLTALTAGLERYWYAGKAAHLDDFQASLKHLEALGCKVD
jgi:hypothetical protein